MFNYYIGSLLGSYLPGNYTEPSFAGSVPIHCRLVCRGSPCFRVFMLNEPPMYDSFRHSHCLGGSPVIKLRLEGRCAPCKAVSFRKRGDVLLSPLCII